MQTRNKLVFIFSFAFAICVGAQIDFIFQQPLPLLITFILYCTAVLCLYPLNMLKFAYMYFSVVGNVLGVYICETSGVYLKELGLFAGYAGSFPLIVAIQMTYLFVLLLLDSDNSEKETIKSGLPINRDFINLIMNIALGIMLACCVYACANPFYELGVDRFEYANLGPTEGLVSKIESLMVFLLPVASAAFFAGSKVRASLFLLMYALTGYMIGNKFGIFLMILYVFILSCYPVFKRFGIRRVRRVLGSLILMVVLLVGLVFAHNSILYGNDLSKNLTYFNQRIAQQGQLWWKSYDLSVNQSSDFAEEPVDFITELAPWAFENTEPIDGRHGIYKIMKETVADDLLFSNKILGKSTYAYSSQATIYKYFGFSGSVILSALLAVIQVFLTNKLISAIWNCRAIQSAICMKLLIMYFELARQSNFEILTSWKLYLYVLIFIFAFYIFDEFSITARSAHHSVGGVFSDSTTGHIVSSGFRHIAWPMRETNVSGGSPMTTILGKICPRESQ